MEEIVHYKSQTKNVKHRPISLKYKRHLHPIENKIAINNLFNKK